MGRTIYRSDQIILGGLPTKLDELNNKVKRPETKYVRNSEEQ